MSNIQTITPENINSITVQYRNQSNGVGIPSIFVTYSTNRIATITLAEVLAYIKYLQIKAALDGKAIIATQFTNFKTVISIGEPEPLPTENIFTFKLDGTNFSAIRNLTPIMNGVVTANSIFTTSFIPGIVSFELPVLSPNGSGGSSSLFSEEYTLPVIANSFFYATNDGIKWTVLFISYNSTPYVGDVSIVSNSFIEFDVTDFSFNAVMFSDTYLPNGLFFYQSSIFIKRDTGYTLNLLASFSQGGSLNVLQYNGASLIDEVKNRGLESYVFNPVNSLVNKIVLQNGNLPVSTFLFAGNAFLGSGIRTLFTDFPGSSSDVNGFFKRVENKIYYNIPASSVVPPGSEVRINLIRNGITIQSEVVTADSVTRSFNVTPGNGDYDHINIDLVVTGTGFAIDLKSFNGNPCGQVATTLYISHSGTIITGDVVYTDISLTTPLAGATQIVNPEDGIIYAIDIVTGVVGAATGSSCPVPPTGKAVFVINNSGQPITIDTDLGSYPFAAGDNGNIQCIGGGFVKNSSVTARTFTFIQSLPSTLDPDESPNPDLLASTASHILNSDLTNLNYIIVI